MKVTALSAQQKDPNRVNVIVDGKFRFSLDVYQIADLGIKVGKSFSDTELREMEVESQFGKLYARARDYCLMRPHSAREIRDYLYRKTLNKKYKSRTGEIKEREGVSKIVTDRVFTRLVDKGYIDDEKFARYWVEHRNLTKGLSKRKLQAELAAKGVERSIVDQQLLVTERTDEDELQKMITKKRARYPDTQKFMQYLARQGFSFDDIKTALSALDND
jgi:regulatory protein